MRDANTLGFSYERSEAWEGGRGGRQGERDGGERAGGRSGRGDGDRVMRSKEGGGEVE